MFNVKPIAGSAPTVVQSAKGGVNGGTTASATLTSTPTVGNTLYVAVVEYAGTITPPTGFTSLGTLPSNGVSMWLGKRTAQSGDGRTYAFTLSQSSYGSIIVFEVAGGGAIDQQASATANQSPYTMPPITPTVADSLAFCVPGRSNGTAQLTVATPAGWTLVQGEPSNYGVGMVFSLSNPSPGTTPVSASGSAALAVTTTATAQTLLWNGDLSTNDYSQYAGDQDTSSDGGVSWGSDTANQIVTSTRTGVTYMQKSTVYSDTTAGSSGPRAELYTDSHMVEGSEFYYGFSFMWPVQSVFASAGQHVIMQFKNDGTGSPPVDLDVRNFAQGDGGSGGGLYLSYSSGNSGVLDLSKILIPMASLADGTWHDIAFHAIFSSDNTVGFLECWLDGTLMLSTHCMTLRAGDNSYLKVGLYGPSGLGDNTHIVYHAAVARGTSRAAVDPSIRFGAQPVAPSGSTALTVTDSGTASVGGYPSTAVLPSAALFPQALPGGVSAAGGAAVTTTTAGAATAQPDAAGAAAIATAATGAATTRVAASGASSVTTTTTGAATTRPQAAGAATVTASTTGTATAPAAAAGTAAIAVSDTATAVTRPVASGTAAATITTNGAPVVPVSVFGQSAVTTTTAGAATAPVMASGAASITTVSAATAATKLVVAGGTTITVTAAAAAETAIVAAGTSTVTTASIATARVPGAAQVSGTAAITITGAGAPTVPIAVSGSSTTTTTATGAGTVARQASGNSPLTITTAGSATVTATPAGAATVTTMATGAVTIREQPVGVSTIATNTTGTATLPLAAWPETATMTVTTVPATLTFFAAPEVGPPAVGRVTGATAGTFARPHAGSLAAPATGTITNT